MALNCFMDTEDLGEKTLVETSYLMEAVRKCDSLKRANAEVLMVSVFCFNAAAAA